MTVLKCLDCFGTLGIASIGSDIDASLRHINSVKSRNSTVGMIPCWCSSHIRASLSDTTNTSEEPKMFYEHRSQPVSFVRKVGEFLSVAVFFRAVHDQCFFGRRGQSDSESEKKRF